MCYLRCSANLKPRAFCSSKKPLYAIGRGSSGAKNPPVCTLVVCPRSSTSCASAMHLRRGGGNGWLVD